MKDKESEAYNALLEAAEYLERYNINDIILKNSNQYFIDYLIYIKSKLENKNIIPTISVKENSVIINNCTEMYNWENKTLSIYDIETSNVLIDIIINTKQLKEIRTIKFWIYNHLWIIINKFKKYKI